MFCIIIALNSRKTFFSIVLCTNMAAVTSSENHLLLMLAYFFLQVMSRNDGSFSVSLLYTQRALRADKRDYVTQRKYKMCVLCSMRTQTYFRRSFQALPRKVVFGGEKRPPQIRLCLQATFYAASRILFQGACTGIRFLVLQRISFAAQYIIKLKKIEGYLTIRPVALDGEGSNCFSITQLVGQKRQ